MLRFLVAVVALACVGFATFTPGSNAEAMEAAAASYRVAPGDTLFSIANRSGMTVSELARLNGISDPDFIVVGQVLQVNVAIAAPARKYTIQPGDTLGAIALAAGAAPEEIATLNGLFSHDRIIAGAVLDLPAAGSTASGPNSTRAAAAGIVWKGSPNFWPGRPQGAPIALVLHTAAGSMVGIDGEFATPRSNLSTNFAVGLDGSVHQYVELADRAWGQGYTETGTVWPGPAGVSPNHLSVSIETEDLGSPYQSVTDAQYRATLDVGRTALRAYPSIRYLVSHRAIAPETRHNDPGPRWIASGRFVALANALGLQPVP